MNSIGFNNPQHLSAVTSSPTVMTDKYFLDVYDNRSTPHGDQSLIWKIRHERISRPTAFI
jgi:hypothetical protein